MWDVYCFDVYQQTAPDPMHVLDGKPAPPMSAASGTVLLVLRCQLCRAKQWAHRTVCAGLYKHLMGAILRRLYDELGQYGGRHVSASEWHAVHQGLDANLRQCGGSAGLTEWEQSTFMRVYPKTVSRKTGAAVHTYNWNLQAKESEMVFMVMPFVVLNVFHSVQAQFEVPDAADPTDSIVECLDCFIKWTHRARAVAFTLETLQELQKCTREAMDLIKHTFPSRKVVNTSTPHVNKPNPRGWDVLMKFHVMEHVPQFVIMYGAWQNCSAAPMEHKHNHTRRSFLRSTDHRSTVDRQVLNAPSI